VVVPSISFPVAELAKIVGVQRYEERLLCATLLLRDPGVRVVYVTSSPIDPDVVDYYLRFLPDPEGARRRLVRVDVGDPAVGSLSEKLLARPAALDRVRAAVGSDGGTMLAFNVTPAEEAVAAALGVTLFGAPARLARLGSKSGARKVAVKAGAGRIDGAENLFSVTEVAAAIAGLRVRRPSAEAVVVKLNNGFSGQGNAILELDNVADPLPTSKTTFIASEESWPTFAAKIEDEGAIVEELLRGDGAQSPSVQLRISTDGEVEILSTHDQILGGPEGQVYLGCRFPAAEEYRSAIVADARRVGAVLAGEGVIGSFGIDFVVVPGDGAYLSEINLRLGGTTHPYWMARWVTGATYDQQRGELVRPNGVPVRYVATDNIKSAQLAVCTPAEVIAAVDEAGLAFDPSTRTGATLHLLGAVPGYGKLGATCIAATAEAADDLYVALVDLLTNR
jgi:hypothetical protein